MGITRPLIVPMEVKISGRCFLQRIAKCDISSRAYFTIHYNKQPPVTVKISVASYDFVSIIRFKGSKVQRFLTGYKIVAISCNQEELMNLRTHEPFMKRDHARWHFTKHLHSPNFIPCLPWVPKVQILPCGQPADDLPDAAILIHSSELLQMEAAWCRIHRVLQI